MKTIFKISISIFLILALFSPLYMYFSHDVAELNAFYPHLKTKANLEADYEIKQAKPRAWTPLSGISRPARWAIILSEDWAFYQVCLILNVNYFIVVFL